jgi:hypothetical protein
MYSQSKLVAMAPRLSLVVTGKAMPVPSSLSGRGAAVGASADAIAGTGAEDPFSRVVKKIASSGEALFMGASLENNATGGR